MKPTKPWSRKTKRDLSKQPKWVRDEVEALRAKANDSTPVAPAGPPPPKRLAYIVEIDTSDGTWRVLPMPGNVLNTIEALENLGAITEQRKPVRVTARGKAATVAVALPGRPRPI